MCNTALSSLRGVREEQRQLSLFKKKAPPPASWSQRFVCLPSTQAEQVPCRQSDKVLLEEAGLGEKVLAVDMNASPEEFHHMIINAFPKLEEGGGFELLRCKPKSKDLLLISSRVWGTPKLLKKRVGNGKIFIRPIQRDLSLDVIDDDEEEEVSE